MVDCSDAIVELVKDTYIHMIGTRNFQENMTKEMWRKEFGTIELRLPRRLGKTHAAAKLLRQFPEAILLTDRYFIQTKAYEDMTESMKMRVYDKRAPKWNYQVVRIESPLVIIDEAFIGDVAVIDENNLVRSLSQYTLLVKLGT